MNFFSFDSSSNVQQNEKPPELNNKLFGRPSHFYKVKL